MKLLLNSFRDAVNAAKPDSFPSELKLRVTSSSVRNESSPYVIVVSQEPDDLLNASYVRLG